MRTVVSGYVNFKYRDWNPPAIKNGFDCQNLPYNIPSLIITYDDCASAELQKEAKDGNISLKMATFNFIVLKKFLF